MNNFFNDDYVIPYRDKLLNFLSSFVNTNDLQYKTTSELEDISNNVIEYANKNNKQTFNEFISSPQPTKKRIFRGNTGNNIHLDKFLTNNQSSGFGGLKLNNNNSPEFDIIDKRYPQTVERKIEDILYPTMADFNPNKKLSLLDNELMVENYKEKILKNGVSWIRPLDKWKKPTSEYGWREHPIYKKWKFHDGIDLQANMNTPVMAVDDGVVYRAEWYNGYGKYIEIDHGGDLHSFYGHLNRIDVSVGDRVYQGDVIGLSGNTGGSTGPHLHFGVKKNGIKKNPNDYLP